MLINACCCEPSCLLFSDDFDRANSNDIGSNWTDSNARIIDNRLGPQALGPMLVLTTQSHTSETMVVDVAMSFSSGSISLDKGIVIVNAKDSNNYLFVQIEVSNSLFSGTAVSTKLKFFRRSGGVSTQLGSTRTIDATNALNNQQVRVCYDGTYLSALGYREAATKITDGFKAGLSSEGSTTIYHNNFRWYKHDPQCPNCTPTPQCGYCFDATEPTGTVILDFGAATLTDSGWNACDQIQGEYILVLNATGRCEFLNFPNCCWGYTATSGTYSDIWCTSKIITLVMVATIQSSILGQSRWVISGEAVVPLNAGCRFAPCSQIGGCVIASFQYSGNHTVHGVCNQSPVTLSKDFQFFNAQPSCTGTMPATIELRLG